MAPIGDITVRAVVDLDDVMEEISSSDLLEELEGRGDMPVVAKTDYSQLDGIKLRDHLASIVQVGAHVSIDRILIELKERYER